MKPVNLTKEQLVNSKHQYSGRMFTANPSSTKNTNKLQFSKRGNSSDHFRDSQKFNMNKMSPNNLITQAPPQNNIDPNVKNLITQAEENRPQTTYNNKNLINSPRPNTEKLSYSLSSSKGLNRNPKVFLPEKSRDKIGKKTLILDLDETLVHSSFVPFDHPDIVLKIELENKIHQIYVLKRPGVEEFLEKMSKHYEIVIYTASLSKYADPLIDRLDPRRFCNHRLFREHCTYINSVYIKDIVRLGRNLKDMIIIDNTPTSFALQVENGIPIKSWYDDKRDRELYLLTPILEFLAYTNDVRDNVKKFCIANEINYQLAYNLVNNAHAESKADFPRQIESKPVIRNQQESSVQTQIPSINPSYNKNMPLKLMQPNINPYNNNVAQPASDGKNINILYIHNDFNNYIINTQNEFKKEDKKVVTKNQNDDKKSFRTSYIGDYSNYKDEQSKFTLKVNQNDGKVPVMNEFNNRYNQYNNNNPANFQQNHNQINTRFVPPNFINTNMNNQLIRPSSAVNVKRPNEGNYTQVNSSGILERKQSSNSVIGVNQNSNRNSVEMNKKPSVMLSKGGNNQLANSSNFSGMTGKGYRPLQNSLNSAEMAEITKNLINNKDGYNTTRPISTSERKSIKTVNQMNNNYLTNSNQSRHNNITNISVKSVYEDQSKRSYSLSNKYEYRPNTNINSSNSNLLKNNEKFYNKAEGDNYRYRDLRLNDDQKYYDKNNNISNNSNKAISRYYSSNKNASSSVREEEYKLRNKNLVKNPQTNLMIKTDLNTNKFRSSNNPLQMSINNNQSTISKNSPSINRSLIVNKVDASFNKEMIKDRYSNMYASN